MLRFAAMALVVVLTASRVEADDGPARIVTTSTGAEFVFPAHSSMRLRQGSSVEDPHFVGRFVLTGEFDYGPCERDCGQGPLTDDMLVLDVVPDPQLAARLPHWMVHGQDFGIRLEGATAFAHAALSARQRADILSRKVDHVTGRIAIVVDDFHAGLGCDMSPDYSARFIALAKPVKLQTATLQGNFGCG